MASKPPPKPKPPANINSDQKARDKYWDDMEKYYKDQGVKDWKNQAKADVNSARDAQKISEDVKKVSDADRARINKLYQQNLGRGADDSGLVTYSKMTDEEIKKAILSSLEYNQRKGNITVLSTRDRDRGQGAEIVFHNNAGGRALMEDKAWIKENIKTGDRIITPKGYGDLKYGGDYDELKQQTDKTALTAEDIKNNPFLSRAGYKPGDYLSYEFKVKKPKSGVFNWIDDAFGTNTARFWDKHVSDQVKGFIHVATLGQTSGLITRNNAEAALRGASKMTGLSEKDVSRGLGYLNVAVDVIAAVATLGASTAVTAARIATAAAIKNSVGAINQYQANQISSRQLFANIGKNVALAYVGGAAANLTRAGATAAQAGTTAAQTGATAAQAGTTVAQTGATAAQAGTTAATSASAISRIGSSIASGIRATGSAIQSGAQAVGSAITSGAQTVNTALSAGGSIGGVTPGLMAARTAVSYGFNRAAGLDDSAAFRSAGWESLGQATAGGSTLFRYATSQSAQKSLRDPVTGEIDPARAIGALVPAGLSIYGAASSSGGYVNQVRGNLTPAAWNPVAGTRILANAANTFYQYDIAGSNIQVTPSIDPAPAGYQPRPELTASSTGSGYNESMTFTRTYDSQYSPRVTATQNRYPSFSGLRNLAADVGNVTIFGSMEPTWASSAGQDDQGRELITSRPIGIPTYTPVGVFQGL